MPRYVKIAAVTFDEPGCVDRQLILDQLARNADELAGYGLDLVVFCEGIEACGQTVEQAEQLDNRGPILEFYREFAKAEQCVVAGSVRLAVDGNIYNSIAFIGPDGETLAAYHKTNLTVGEIEEGLRSGGGAVVVDSPVGRLGGVICFDLNFETLRDEYIALRPEILTFSTMYHGGLAQALWAYACRSYLVSALPFLGGGIIDPYGRPVQLTDEYNKHAIASINLDYVIVHLDYNREKFPDILRKYNDEIIIDIPAHVGSAMISSRSEDVSAADIVREFELELLDDYFARSKLANARNR